MSREAVGAFIDAIYAIALTILALEVPGEIEGRFSLERLGMVLLEYAVAFTILFAFWLQHRRIAGLQERHGRTSLWLNALVLLLVCIVPRATTLVFEYGGDVTLRGLHDSIHHHLGMTTAEIVDLLYVTIVVCADVGLLLLVRAVPEPVSAGEHRALRTAKNVSTLVVLVVVGLSFAFPVENRWFLLALPVVLFFEREILRMVPVTRTAAEAV